MVWAAPALAAVTLCLRISTDPVKAAAAALIFGAILSNAEHPHLGAQVCELEPGTILASDSNILEKMKLCPALTGAQRDALNALLLSGHTAYGDPSSWDLQTLQDLGPLVLALNRTTLSLVAEAAREDFRRSIAAAYIRQGYSQREKSLTLLKALAAAPAASPPRLRRSEDHCLYEPITPKNIDDILILLSPDELDQLDACLSNDVLIQNLEDVVVLPIPSQGLQVLKKKVDEFFQGSGIPDEQLRRLGPLSRLYTEEEISQWSVTSSDTISALLNSSGGPWNDSQMQQLFTRYLKLGGNLCDLQEEQIQQIPAGAIRTAGQLNISSCSQSKKEQLYRKAQEAFASLASTPSTYYCQIRPYLGGAPAEDLKNLANACVAINMDLSTFLALNPEELQKLSVTDVKCLLGENLCELKKAEHEPSVVSWVQLQSQQELDCVLGIGLQGGWPEPTGTACPAVTCPAVTSPASGTSSATVTTSPQPATSASGTSTATVTTSPHPATPANVTPVPTTLPPVPSTSVSVTSTATVTTSPHPVTSDNVTSTATVTTSPHPVTSDNVTSTATVTTSPHPVTSDNVTSTATVPPVPTATPTAHPAVTSAVPCSTHQAATTHRATSSSVTLLSTLLATSSPSATPVPAVTSRATTSTSGGTSLAGTTHSAVTTVPNPTSAPTVTPVPHSPSAPAATPAPMPSSTPIPSSTPVPSSTPIPISTIPTQTSLGSSTAVPCQPSSPPEPSSPSSSPKTPPGSVPEPPQPTSNGYIVLQPAPGSGSRLCSCLALLLAAASGTVLGGLL